MHQVVVRRCPYSPSIRSHAAGIVKALEADLYIRPNVEDGAKDELSVWVDGAVVIRRNGDALPPVSRVMADVRKVVPVGV